MFIGKVYVIGEIKLNAITTDRCLNQLQETHKEDLLKLTVTSRIISKNT